MLKTQIFFRDVRRLQIVIKNSGNSKYLINTYAKCVYISKHLLNTRKSSYKGKRTCLIYDAPQNATYIVGSAQKDLQC